MKSIYFFIILLPLFSCSTDMRNGSTSHSPYLSQLARDSSDQAISNPAFDYIIYGSSFGECSGYCITETKFEQFKRTTVQKSWSDSPNFPAKTVTSDMRESDWNRINESIDFANFRKLPTKIGCPDCTDGGACWVEIACGGIKHRVTFECHYPPKELTELIDLLVK